MNNRHTIPPSRLERNASVTGGQEGIAYGRQECAERAIGGLAGAAAKIVFPFLFFLLVCMYMI